MPLPAPHSSNHIYPIKKNLSSNIGASGLQGTAPWQRSDSMLLVYFQLAKSCFPTMACGQCLFSRVLLACRVRTRTRTLGKHLASFLSWILSRPYAAECRSPSAYSREDFSQVYLPHSRVFFTLGTFTYSGSDT